MNESIEPNLTISHDDIEFMPNPGNQGEDVTISAIVSNPGFGLASDIQVDFYHGVPHEGGELLGNQIIPMLAAGANTIVSLDWTNVAESGKRIIYVQIDPENEIAEISEDDNSAFTTFNILCVSDLILSTGSIELTPSTPREGDLVSIAVTVQNAGEQEASNISVIMYEEATIIESQKISSIPGNSQAVASFTYDTSGKPGSHEITVVIDPDNLILEQHEDNNQASRTFGVQNADLWLTERYISPNGDGVKESTQFFFRLDIPQTVRVVVVNDDGETVRIFDDDQFENTIGGNITWDGFDTRGMVVKDGQYRIQILDSAGNVLKGMLVIVDNNRSPLTEALGTRYLVENRFLEIPDSDDYEVVLRLGSGFLMKALCCTIIRLYLISNLLQKNFLPDFLR